jgi:hypothetical protein
LSLVIFVAALAAAPATRPIDEDQATLLVLSAVRQLYPREAPQCFSLLTEERSRSAFDIVVYEKHNRRCGGDPAVMHVRDRFRVSRSPVRLLLYDAASDLYRRCRLNRAMRASCPN